MFFCCARILNSCTNDASTSLRSNVTFCGVKTPASSFVISSSMVNKLWALLSEFTTPSDKLANSLPSVFLFNIDANSDAALKGCIKS